MTPLPSADLWEDPWEANFDLFAIRGRKRRLKQAHAFAAELKPDRALRIPDASVIEALVTDLDIGAEEAEQLAEDIELLTLWHTLPELWQTHPDWPGDHARPAAADRAVRR